MKVYSAIVMYDTCARYLIKRIANAVKFLARWTFQILYPALGILKDFLDLAEIREIQIKVVDIGRGI
jgi:hypothetical protein